MAKASRSNQVELRKAIKRIERLKLKAAAVRDEMREALDDLGGVLESFDRADESLESGIRELQDAVSAMSEFV